jgi:hypothetical protein
MRTKADAITRSGLPLVIGALATLSFVGFAEMALPSLRSGPQPGAPGNAVATERRTMAQESAPEVIVYASELPNGALSEFSFRKESTSPGGRFAVTPNTGGELDPPPEDDPNVRFKVPVRAGVPYRCWIHMKVGEPKGKSQANKFWVQFSDAVDKANKPVLKPGTGSYLTAQGPTRSGWTWVGCDMADPPSADALVTFRTTGEVTVRMQAGMEGVGFDQFLLSPGRFLKQPPTEAVVKKS